MNHTDRIAKPNAIVEMVMESYSEPRIWVIKSLTSRITDHYGNKAQIIYYVRFTSWLRKRSEYPSRLV